jgi:hypothetical protein
MRPATARVPSPAPTRQLELRETSSRLVALLRERQRLLTNVARKKSKLEKVLASLDAQHAQMAHLSSTVEPLLEQARQLDREVHALFATILARPTLKRKDRRLIQELYEILELEGILTPAPSPDDDIFGASEFDDRADHRASEHPTGEFPPWVDPTDEIPSARRSTGSTATAMRDLFRRLASAIHPDKVQDEHSREKRTEAMKELTRAYQDGDLARLIELEKEWLTGTTPDVGNDEDETARRCTSLEQTNRELKRQLKELDAKMREARRSGPAEVAAALGLGGKHGDARLGEIISNLEGEVETLRETRAFVQSFVDGKITCAQFIAGPATRVPDDDAEMADLDDFLADIFGPSDFPPPVRRQGRRRRRK